MSAVITGQAWRTPLGNEVDAVTLRLLAGDRALANNPRFDASSYACTVGAALPERPAPSRHARFVRRMGLYAIECGVEALQRSGAPGGDRLGLYCGVGGLRAHWEEMMPALAAQEPSGEGAWARGLSRLHPFWMLRYLSNNAHALLSAEVGARGEGATFGGANAGAQALSQAVAALEEGAIDAALVVAYDSLLEPEMLVALAASGALARGTVETIAGPYDVAANGAVPGEAAAALVLERREAAGPRAIALLEARECADGAKAEPYASTLSLCAAPLARDIGLVDGAARTRAALDAAERDSLADLVGPSTPLIALSASLGACGAATAVLQAIALSRLLSYGRLPKIAGLRRAAKGPLRPIHEAESTTARAALALSGGAPGLAGAIRIERLQAN